MVAIRLQHVWETLPDARFVCIVRDLEPVAASWEARARRTPRTSAGAPTRTPPRRWPAGTARCAGSAARSGSAPTTRWSSSTTASSATRAGASLGKVLAWLGLDRSPEIDAAFAQVHATYVEKVAPKQRTLSPETLAFLDEHAERDVWDQVTTELAL